MQSMMRKGEKKVIWKYFCINHDLLTSFQTKNKLEKEGTTFAQILKPAAKVNKNNFILRLKNKKMNFFGAFLKIVFHSS